VPLKDVLIICHHNVYRVVAVDNKPNSTAQNAIVATCRGMQQKRHVYAKTEQLKHTAYCLRDCVLLRCTAAMHTQCVCLHKHCHSELRKQCRTSVIIANSCTNQSYIQLCILRLVIECVYMLYSVTSTGHHQIVCAISQKFKVAVVRVAVSSCAERCLVRHAQYLHLLCACSNAVLQPQLNSEAARARTV
jgi:hypothetical protein